MQPQTLEQKLRRAIIRPVSFRRASHLIHNAAQQSEYTLKRSGLGRDYGIKTQGRRILILDLKSEQAVNEVCLDVVVVGTKRKLVVYNVFITGSAQTQPRELIRRRPRPWQHNSR